MDPREHRYLKNLGIEPVASPVRPLIVAVLGVAVVGVAAWLAFGRTSAPATAATQPNVAVAPAAPAVAADNPARQVAGTIPTDASKPATAASPAAPAPATASAPAPATQPAPAPAQAEPANVAAPVAPPADAPAESAPPIIKLAAASPGLKMDTEFASAKRIVPFAFNKIGVGPLGTLAVRELAPLAKQAEKVYVRGRTDGLGNAGANRKVALDRAYTVFTAFLREGVQKQKLRLTYCSTCFVASNDTEEGRRLNRRVEVELIMPRDEIAKLPKPVHAPESPPLIAPLAASDILESIRR